MTGLNTSKVITACDLGSTQISMVAAHIDEEINVLGSVRLPNQSVRAGQILSLEQLTDTLHDALDELEQQTGLSIESMRCTLPTHEIKSISLSEHVFLKSGEVQDQDIEKLVNQIRSSKVDPKFEWLHLQSTHFELDGKKSVTDPRGLFGTELHLHSHGIFAPTNEMRSLARAVQRAGLRLEGASFQGLNAAYGSTSREERELGCLLVHLGASATSCIEFENGRVVYAGQIPVGSHHITKDVSVGLRATLSESEHLKKSYGLIAESMDPPMTVDGKFEEIEVEIEGGEGKRILYRKDLSLVIEARVMEILNLVAKKTFHERSRNPQQISKGIILTGGGSQLNGLVHFVERVLRVPTRIGTLCRYRGVSNDYKDVSWAPVLGLLDPMFESVNQEPKALEVSRNRPSIWSRITRSFIEAKS